MLPAVVSRAQVWPGTRELMGLGGLGWARGTSSRAGDSRNTRNTGQDSQPAAGGPFEQLQPLWMAPGEGKAKPVGGEHCAL